MSSSSPGRPLPRVLLIDDDAISREVLAMMLEMHGFTVDSAEDGKLALQFMETAAEPPGLILMDAQMPGVSGLRLIKALRQRAKDRGADAGLRIVAISGSEVSDSIHRAADGFLLKPIRVESLLALIESQPALAEAAALELRASADSPASEVIDPAVLGKLKAMMPAAVLRETYTAVASDMEMRLGALEKAIDAGDAAEVARAAHTIKGGCAMVGLSGAREAAARLESGNPPETWPKELSQLHFALEKLLRMLEDGLL